MGLHLTNERACTQPRRPVKHAYSVYKQARAEEIGGGSIEDRKLQRLVRAKGQSLGTSAKEAGLHCAHSNEPLKVSKEAGMIRSLI